MPFHDRIIPPKKERITLESQSREPERCRVCGSKEISRYWSARVGPLAYCSFRCNAIGQRYVGVILTLLLFLFMVTTENDAVFLVTIFFELLILPITIYGFVEKRRD
ncbi:MAG: hypothetical protein ACFFAJ_15580 [Candidatus Hodarchaeota archaeon]